MPDHTADSSRTPQPENRTDEATPGVSRICVGGHASGAHAEAAPACPCGCRSFSAAASRTPDGPEDKRRSKEATYLREFAEAFLYDGDADRALEGYYPLLDFADTVAAASRTPDGETPGIYAEIAAERDRAHAKHGAKSMESAAWDDMKRLRILMEEVGEIAKVFNEFDLGVITLAEARQQCRRECIQTAAMATAWAEGAGRG